MPGYEVLPNYDPLETVIKVIGVGGGGGNAVEHMISKGAQGIEFICANTDHQALKRSKAHVNIQLGNTGLGAGARPEIGAAAAEEKREQIADAIRGANLLFITAGMGGGTGTGAAPVIADVAREQGILTIAVVTKPFSFEGSRRMRTAENGILNLKDKVDSMIVILNEKLEELCEPDATMQECFDMCNSVLYKACVGIADIIHTPGMINVDFEDVKTVMSERGSAIIGLASASGPDRAKEAAEKAIVCPLLEGANLQGARGMLVNFTGSEGMTLTEVKRGMEILRTFVTPQAGIIYGAVVDNDMGDELRVTVVATGLDGMGDSANQEPNVPSVAEAPVVKPVVDVPTIQPAMAPQPTMAQPSTVAVRSEPEKVQPMWGTSGLGIPSAASKSQEEPQSMTPVATPKEPPRLNPIDIPDFLTRNN